MRASEALAMFLDARPDQAGWALRFGARFRERYRGHAAEEAELAAWRSMVFALWQVLGDGFMGEVVRHLRNRETLHEEEGRLIRRVAETLDRLRGENGKDAP